MYIVRNLTNKPIVLSDIRVEIGPYKIVDLESITSRDNIERSQALKQALKNRHLQFVKQTVIKVPSVIPPSKVVEIHKSDLDEDKLKEMVRSVIKEQMEVSDEVRASSFAAHEHQIMQAVTRTVATGMDTVMDSIRDKLNSIVPQNIADPRQSSIDISVDPSKLAEMQQKAVEKISQDIDTNKIKGGKRIKLIDHKISDLANEL